MRKTIIICIILFVGYRLLYAERAGTIEVDNSELSITYYEYLPERRSSDDSLPLIFLLHGQGDHPKNFYDTFIKDEQPHARIVSISAPFRGSGFGRSWGPTPSDRKDAAAALQEAFPVLLEKFKAPGPPTVLGYSMGAGIALALATQTTEKLGKVILVSSYIDDTLLPAQITREPERLLVYHGDSDKIARIGNAKKAVEHLRNLGAEVEFFVRDGVKHHGIFLSMREELIDELILP